MPAMELQTLDRRKRLHPQAADQIRRQIQSGRLLPGKQLPSTLELTRAWQTTTNTVQAALNTLVKEGWVVRIPGRGSFVRAKQETLTRVGLYYSSLDDTRKSAFQQAVRTELERLLAEQGMQIDLCVDARPHDQQRGIWSELLTAAQERRIQALIAQVADKRHVEWLRKLPVPIAFGGTSGLPQSVDHDLGAVARLGVTSLHEQGCRSIGAITPACLEDFRRGELPFAFSEFFTTFFGTAKAQGVEVRDEWVRGLRTGPQDASTQERFGYEQFNELWDAPDRPAGLLVFHDLLARGALAAVLEKNVRVPEDLKLVLYKNKHVGLFCPSPVPLLVLDEAEVAQALIDQVRRQFFGEKTERVRVVPRLEIPTPAG